MNVLILTIATLRLAVVYLVLRLRAVEAELKALTVDPVWGINSRQGLDRRWRGTAQAADRFAVVFFDLDAMHQANERLGYAEVDRRIKAALSLRGTDLFIARWYSGDEIVALVPAGDALGTAQRLLAGCRRRG